MSSYILILTYHVDPGHGWVETPAALIDRLGILDQISEYSYFDFDRQVYYLEEDCDASLLVETLKANGIEYVFHEKEYHKTAPLTRFPRVGACE